MAAADRSPAGVEPTTSASTHFAASAGPLSANRRAVIATCAANAIEWYDFAVYGALASVLAVVFLPPGPNGGNLVTIFAVFATSFLARPFGAVLIGARADRIGRRRSLAFVVLLMTVATGAVGLLPSWSAIGLAAPVLLVLFRVVQGFASGGEISTSVAYLLDSAPRRRWGYVGGLHLATTSVGIAIGSAAAGWLAAVMPGDAFHRWGWRIPFLLALPLGLVGLYLRRYVVDPEDRAGSASSTRTGAVRTVWRDHRRAMWTGFLLAGLLTGTFNMFFVFLPSFLATHQVHALPTALGSAVAGILAAAVTAVLVGRLSDVIGRRPVLLTAAAAGCLAWPLLLMLAQGTSATGLLIADLIAGVILGSLVTGTFIAERFADGIRSTGVALSYGLGTVVVGGTAPLLGSVLSAGGSTTGLAAYLVLVSAAGVVAVALAPAPID